MGMMDFLHSSFDLGPDFTNVELHTKDIEDGIGGTMSHYWLDPHGYLYHIDYSHTADFVEIVEGDDEYDFVHPWCNIKIIPNGNHGKITPCIITRYVEVYPGRWEGRWEDWPRCKIHFKYGRLMDYEYFAR